MLILDFYLQIMNHRQKNSITERMILSIRFEDLSTKEALLHGGNI